MEIKNFIENFAAQFEETDAEVFTPETTYRELDEWSSLVALSVLAMIDEEYDVQLKGDEMRGTKTIQELFDLVNSKID
jgi:acyl carrier protein